MLDLLLHGLVYWIIPGSALLYLVVMLVASTGRGRTDPEAPSTFEKMKRYGTE